MFQSDGTFVGKFGSHGNKIGQLEHPHYIAVSNTNRVIVSDCNNHRIQIFDVNGRVISSFGTEGADNGQFKFPKYVLDAFAGVCVCHWSKRGGNAFSTETRILHRSTQKKIPLLFDIRNILSISYIFFFFINYCDIIISYRFLNEIGIKSEFISFEYAI